MGTTIDITGQQFGRLVVLEYMGINKHNKALWKCRCDCGAIKNIPGVVLRKGATKSCGCLRKELNPKHNRTHGLSREPLYIIWIGMKARCYYKKHKDYHNYGGRGICICKSWSKSYMAFLSWCLENGYEEKCGLSIDRVDVDGEYSPTNCRIITATEQSRNRRNNRYIVIGDEKKCLKDWAAISGVQPSTIHFRLLRGWSPERAIFETPRKMRKTK